MASKLALQLLALAIGLGLLLCVGTQTDPNCEPKRWTCPGGGQAFLGYNRPNVTTCTSPSVFCTTDVCPEPGPDDLISTCDAECVDGTILTIFWDARGFGSTLTFRDASSAVVNVDNGVYQGECGTDDYYCSVPADGQPTTARLQVECTKSLLATRSSFDESWREACFLQYADFCYTPPPPPPPVSSPPPPPVSSPPPPPVSSPPPPPVPSPPPPPVASPPPPPVPSPPPSPRSSPPPPPRSSPPPPLRSSAPPPACQCVKGRVTFFWNGSPIKDVSLCPGMALPDETLYTATDNCGKTLRVTVGASSKHQAHGPCCTITRTLNTPCGVYAYATKHQKITYEDRIMFSSGCPVEASSNCNAGARVLTPVVSYTNSVFKAVYTAKDACGMVQTKTVTR